MPIRFSLAFSAASVLLAGCAAQGDFPSLAPRAVEGELSPAAGCRREGACAAADPEPAAAAAVADDPRLAARILELAERARSGDRAFASLLPEARRSAARAGRSGSEPWIEAQQLVSRLEAARSPTVDALAELDALSLARSEDAGTSPPDRERLAAAAQEARALADAQRVELERLNGQLSAL
jgi:hypothetical protein